MDRNQVIEGLKEIALKLSEEFGCSVLYESEDRQKGVWGENVTKALENSYGECTHEFKLVSEQTVPIKNYRGEITEKPETSIQFRYRFATPCLAINHYDGQKQVFAEIEITDWDSNKQDHVGKDWHIGQFTIFEAEGMDFANLLRSEWDKFASKEKEKAKSRRSIERED